MKDVLTRTVAEIVSEDYRTSVVFSDYGIDFCCKGYVTLIDACRNKNIALADLERKLEMVTAIVSDSPDFGALSLDLLADHIELKHHTYVEQKIPVLTGYLDKLCAVHGIRHPELYEVRKLFLVSAGELTKHMKKEEFIVFPRIRKLAYCEKNGEIIRRPAGGTIENSIKALLSDHEAEGERFERIRELTNVYSPPAEACNTYTATLSLMREFELDLHQHIHLENNALFPKAVTLETVLLKRHEN